MPLTPGTRELVKLKHASCKHLEHISHPAIFCTWKHGIVEGGLVYLAPRCAAYPVRTFSISVNSMANGVTWGSRFENRFDWRFWVQVLDVLWRAIANSSSKIFKGTTVLSKGCEYWPWRKFFKLCDL